MHVVIASLNPAKKVAVEQAFRAAPGIEGTLFSAVAVPSGVAEQPVSDEETRRGARQRVAAARLAVPEADYWVGLEGGLERIDGAWMGSAWMVVVNRAGGEGMARTPTLPLPPAVQTLLDQGLELGVANDQVFNTRDSKRKGGAFGLLTDGQLTRAEVYAQAVTLALMPLLHPLWRA